MSETVIQILRGDGPWFFAEELAKALRNFVFHEGGLWWAGWEGTILKVRLQGIPRGRIRLAVRVFCALIVKERISLSLTLIETKGDGTPLPDIAGESIRWGTFLEPVLSKALIFALPTGAYIVGNYLKYRPPFAAKLGPKERREPVWRRALESNAPHRRCSIAWSAEQFAEQKLLRAGRARIQSRCSPLTLGILEHF